jgi:sugar phosphate isomerase/epimerase
MEKLRNNCYKLAAYADSMNSKFACETGTEKAVAMKKFLDDLGAKGLATNMDPANLVMVAKDDPVQAVYTLKDYIVHTHAKDGIVTDQTKHGWLEVPLGTGGVDWDNYLKALNDIGYQGYLTIEREVGENPGADIAMAVDFLKGKLSSLNIQLG